MKKPSNRAGETIRRLRTLQGMSQRNLAGDRYTPQYISSLEAGRARPSERALIYLSDRLRVTPGSLLDGQPTVTTALDAERLLVAERALAEAARALQSLRESLGATGAAALPASDPSDSHIPGRSRVRKSGTQTLGRADQATLHEAIVDVLRTAGAPLSATAIAGRVTTAGWRSPRSARELDIKQIYARTTHQHYRKLFTRRGGLIGLAEWQPA